MQAAVAWSVLSQPAPRARAGPGRAARGQARYRECKCAGEAPLEGRRRCRHEPGPAFEPSRLDQRLRELPERVSLDQIVRCLLLHHRPHPLPRQPRLGVQSARHRGLHPRPQQKLREPARPRRATLSPRGQRKAAQPARQSRAGAQEAGTCRVSQSGSLGASHGTMYLPETCAARSRRSRQPRPGEPRSRWGYKGGTRVEAHPAASVAV